MEYIDENGEIIEYSGDKIDEIIAQLKVVKTHEGELREIRYSLECELAALAATVESDTKVKRVAGSNFTVKITFKEYVKWDVKQLNDIREEVGDGSFMKYFRVGEYKPNAREMKKLAGTAGAGEELLAKFDKAKEVTPAKPYVQIEGGE